jgi:hypothetical protein
MNLTPDTKYLVGQKLSGKDLVNLCSTDREMRKICSSDKYNKLWQDKLKEDHDVNYEGKNAYMEYLQNTYFYKKKYYTVIEETNGYTTHSFIFTEKKEGINWIYHQLKIRSDPLSFPIVNGKLESDGEINCGIYKYYIMNSVFKKSSVDYLEKYKEKLREIYLVIGKDKKDRKKMEDFVDDFISNYDDNYDESIEFFKKDDDFNFTKEGIDLIEQLIIDPDFILK